MKGGIFEKLDLTERRQNTLLSLFDLKLVLLFFSDKAPFPQIDKVAYLALTFDRSSSNLRLLLLYSLLPKHSELNPKQKLNKIIQEYNQCMLMVNGMSMGTHSFLRSSSGADPHPAGD